MPDTGLLIGNTDFVTKIKVDENISLVQYLNYWIIMLIEISDSAN